MSSFDFCTTLSEKIYCFQYLFQRFLVLSWQRNTLRSSTHKHSRDSHLTVRGSVFVYSCVEHFLVGIFFDCPISMKNLPLKRYQKARSLKKVKSVQICSAKTIWVYTIDRTKKFQVLQSQLFTNSMNFESLGVYWNLLMSRIEWT